MTILPVRKYPDPILRKQAREVSRIRKRTLSLIANMVETMRAGGGIGLAANQVGVLRRIIIVDVTPLDRLNKKRDDDPIVLINPEILSGQGENILEEGCLSFPGITGKVKRAYQIRVRGLNVQGERIEMKATGLPAQVIQHEVDHLDGVLFIDRMDEETRESIRTLFRNDEA